MFLARTLDEQGRPIIGIGLRPEDVQRLVSGRPVSFSLRDARVDGPEAAERVLVAFAQPHQVEQMRHGYFPGLTDARVLIYVEHHSLKHLHSGRHLDIQTPGTPVARFVVFLGTGHDDAIRAFQQAGLRVRKPSMPPAPTPLTADRLEQLTSPAV